MRQGFTESVVEEAALAWLGWLGWMAKHGLKIAPGELAAERADFGQAVLERHPATRCCPSSSAASCA
jgi:type I restriction enzyme R subunit